MILHGQAFFYPSVSTFIIASYLFFGKETAGLPEDLLFKNKNRCVRIPMISEARSLNLSNSIAIGVYEVLRQWDFPALSEAGRLRGYDWDAADANGAK